MRTFTYLGPNSASLRAMMNGGLPMDDGTILPTWFFRPNAGGLGFNNDRTVPSPVIEAIEGETVEITLNSTTPHTIHPHGLDVPQAHDGVASTSGFVSSNPPTGGFGRVDGYTNLGSPYTYTFTAPHAGTYIYHCHVDTVLHFARGMYGTVIVRPPDGAVDRAWAGGPSFDVEYIWQLSTFDSGWHAQMVSDSNTVRHRPDFFALNGRDGAAAMTDPTAALLVDGGKRVLIRTANVAYQPAVVQLGGHPFDVIASDGRPLAGPRTGVTEQLVAPGERYDLLFTMPPDADGTATVEYLNPRLTAPLGTVSTRIRATSLFADGFESGGTSRWSATVS